MIPADIDNFPDTPDESQWPGAIEPGAVPVTAEIDNERRLALIELAEALDALKFTRAFAGKHSGEHVLAMLRNYARTVAYDLPDEPLRDRARLRARIKQMTQEIKAARENWADVG